MIPLFKPVLAPNIPLEDVFSSGQLAEGPRVQQFELELEKLLGCPVVTTNSGTSALHLAYVLAGVKPGSIVITTPMTCLATNLPLLHLGAQIVWADVDEEGLLDPLSVEKIIHQFIPTAQAIVGVEYGGLLCDWNELRELGVSIGAWSISDSSHAWLAQGTEDSPHFSTFSFQAIKHLTCGDGGAVISPWKGHERARLLRWFGLDRTKGGFRCEQEVHEVGYKFHMNDIAATIGLANLPYSIASVEIARDNARFYSEHLKDIDGLELPRPRLDTNPSWWSYVLRVPAKSRAKFIEKMAEMGVQCARIHSRNDVHPIFKNAITPFPLKGVERFDSMQVSIPVGYHIGYREREHIVEAVRRSKCW